MDSAARAENTTPVNANFAVQIGKCIHFQVLDSDRSSVLEQKVTIHKRISSEL